MLNSLSHILVIHSFSRRKVIACQLLVKLQLPTFILVAILYIVFKQKIVINSSL